MSATSERALGGADRARRSLGPSSERLAGWLLAAPAVAGLLLFVVLPFAIAVGMSFASFGLNEPLPVRWIGLGNYERLAGDPTLRRAFLNNLLFAAGIVPLQTGLALGLALLVDRTRRGSAVLRTLFFLPVVFPMALVSGIWALILAPGPQGPMNHLLGLVTLGSWSPDTDFLHDERLALPSLMLMSLWQGAGFQMVILLAALQTIPSVLRESAAVDGAGAWRRFWHVTLPGLRAPLVFVAMVTAILAFRLFDQVWILTQGGPGEATTTILYEAYVAGRERNQIGLGAAATVLLCAFVGLAALGFHAVARRASGVR